MSRLNYLNRRASSASRDSNRPSSPKVQPETISSYPSLGGSPGFKAYQTYSIDEEESNAHINTDFQTEHSLGDHPRASAAFSLQRPSFSRDYRSNSIQNELKSRGDPTRNSFAEFGTVMENDYEVGDMYSFSENNATNEAMRALEAKLSRLEQRLEANENLIHTYDEEERLNQMEVRNMKAQEENAGREICARLSALELKMGILEEDLREQKDNVNNRVDDFTGKIEEYLERFIKITTNLGEKFDMLTLNKDREDKKDDENLNVIDVKLDKIAEEIRERLKVLYDMVEDVGSLARGTTQALEGEKYNVQRLEDDFLRVLTASKDLSQSSGDTRRLKDDMMMVKSQQMMILNFLNFGVAGDSLEGLAASPSDKRYGPI